MDSEMTVSEWQWWSQKFVVFDGLPRQPVDEVMTFLALVCAVLIFWGARAPDMRFKIFWDAVIDTFT